MEKAYRQGELVFVPKVEKVTKENEGRGAYYTFKSKGTKVIREGEITGHCHVVEKGEILTDNRNMVLDNPDGAIIVHPEHKPLKLPGISEVSPVGEMDIIIQREYDEANDKYVND